MYTYHLNVASTRVSQTAASASAAAASSTPFAARDALRSRSSGGIQRQPPLERLLNASRAANGVDDASAADALAAVWETRVLATFKQ